ncbi:MAG: GNAT family N-acetyltransferase, partial [Clostridia bacterium]|nr:GNAT family N-acetyltransferase [Clostridia bacterium]
IRLHEGFGFREVGRFEKSGYKLGKWHDVVWLYLPLADFPENPPEPLPFRQLDAHTLQTIL